MRALFLAAAVLALGACADQQPSANAGCARAASQEVTWSSDAAPDTVTARADGPTCGQAIVTLAVRNAAGDALWAFSSTYYDLTAGGAPPEGAAPVSGDEIDRFLAGWANVTMSTSGELPEWREDAATLTESATTFAYDTPFDREIYEMLRQRNLRTLCFAAAVEATQCLIVDPASNTPALIVTYGP